MKIHFLQVSIYVNAQIANNWEARIKALESIMKSIGENTGLKRVMVEALATTHNINRIGNQILNFWGRKLYIDMLLVYIASRSAMHPLLLEVRHAKCIRGKMWGVNVDDRHTMFMIFEGFGQRGVMCIYGGIKAIIDWVLQNALPHCHILHTRCKICVYHTQQFQKQTHTTILHTVL